MNSQCDSFAASDTQTAFARFQTLLSGDPRASGEKKSDLQDSYCLKDGFRPFLPPHSSLLHVSQSSSVVFLT